MKRGWLSFSLMLCLAAGAWAAPADSSDVSALIDRLASLHPRERADAREQLARLGPAARVALRDATHSNHPEIRAQAGLTLRAMPWYLPSDPQRVRTALVQYGKPDLKAKQSAIEQLAQLPANLGFDALIRILRDEPSEMMRWQVVSWLRMTALTAGGGGPLFERVAQLDPSSDNAPMLTLVGLCWRGRDEAKSEQLLSRAIEIQLTGIDPPGDGISAAFESLVEVATARRNWARAVELRRRQPDFADDSEGNWPGLTAPLADLILLHGAHGTLRGLLEDLRQNPRLWAFPHTWYALARLADRATIPLAGAVLREVALGLSGDVLSQNAVAYYLFNRKWHAEAVAEFHRLARTPGDEPEAIATRFRSLWFASRMEAAEEDYVAAGDDVQAALKIAGQSPFAPEQIAQFVGHGSAEELHAEAAWRIFRAALARGDKKLADAQLERLRAIRPADMSMALDLVPILKDQKNDEFAKIIFDPAFEVVRAMLAENPDSPEVLNNIAWLAARCGEHLDDALIWANKAVAIQPQNAAYLDTLAEVHFSRGNPAEAARIERQALQFQPGDEFMTKQLRRFEAAIKP